jgi:DNA-binding response OmpR family regulator
MTLQIDNASSLCFMSGTMRILVAEDEAPLADFLCRRLLQEKFSVQMVVDGREAERLTGEQTFDLVLLDLGLTGVIGLDVLRRIRSKKPYLPVMILTQTSNVEERVKCLDAGAEDCLAKPFAFTELVARIRAAQRRGNRPARSVLKLDDLELDRMTRSVQRGGHNLKLSPKEFALLEFLMEQAGQVVTRTSILEKVWSSEFGPTSNMADVYINYLRRKVDTGFDRKLIQTVRGVGYQIGGTLNYDERRPDSQRIENVFPSPTGAELGTVTVI